MSAHLRTSCTRSISRPMCSKTVLALNNKIWCTFTVSPTRQQLNNKCFFTVWYKQREASHPYVYNPCILPPGSSVSTTAESVLFTSSRLCTALFSMITIIRHTSTQPASEMFAINIMNRSNVHYNITTDLEQCHASTRIASKEDRWSEKLSEFVIVNDIVLLFT